MHRVALHVARQAVLVQFERKFCQLKADFLKGQITRAFQPTEDIVNADV